MTVKDLYFFLIILITYLTAAGLVQSVERLTAEREVAGLIPGAGPTLGVLDCSQSPIFS